MPELDDESTDETEEGVAWFQERFTALVDNIEQVIRGKRGVVELSALALFTEGHLLLEDVPGLGKTSLARALARSIDASASRN